jgi:hypothetical protein
MSRVADWVGEQGAAPAEDRPRRQGARLAVLAMSLSCMGLPPLVSILVLLGVVS